MFLKFIRIILKVSVLYTFFLFSCNNNVKVNKNLNSFSQFKNKYAELYRIEKNKNLTILSVSDKNKSIKESYFLMNYKKTVPDSLKNKNIIFTPVKKVVCLSTTHIAFLDLLNETDKIVAVSGSKYVYNRKLKNKIQNGEIKDAGYENSLDFELLLSLKPDLVTVYNINGNLSPAVNKLKQYDIPVIQINEYLESSVLGQAEWLKFFAEFFEKENTAEQKFSEIETNYSNFKKITKNITHKPTILLNMPWKGTWYVPGGKSNVAQLIADAGGNYVFKNSDERHNSALSTEEVYAKARNADFWLNPGQAKTINDITATDVRLKKFSALKTGNVYNRNKRLSPSGGNDYMESGTVRPDLILKDLIQILHPELIKNDSLFFYRKLR